MMHPAQNLPELIQNLLTGRRITEGQFYVPIYEPTLEAIRYDLTNTVGGEGMHFVVGQSGNGKTTALQFLANKDLETYYRVVFVNGRDLFSAQDVEVIDLLLLICNKLSEQRPDLKERYVERIETYAKLFSGRLIIDDTKEHNTANQLITEGGLSLPKLIAALGLKLNVSGSMSASSSDRKIIREIFKPRIEDLLTLSNEIIGALEKDGRRILLIVDDLEKLKVLQQVRELFLEHTPTLRRLNCQKVFTMPGYFPISRELEVSVWHMWLAVRANPLVDNKSGTKRADAIRQQFEKLLYCRMVEPQKLIDPAALSLAIDHSGGNPRQYIELLYRSAQIAHRYEGLRIRSEDIKEAVSQLARARTNSATILAALPILSHIRQHHLPPKEFEPEDLYALLAGNQIFSYHDDLPWYGLDPIIESTVDRYSKLYG